MITVRTIIAYINYLHLNIELKKITNATPSFISIHPYLQFKKSVFNIEQSLPISY